MKFHIPKFLADIGLKIHRAYYQQRFRTIYMGKHPPSWFDHRIDLYAHWPHNLFWIERGVFPRKYMVEGCSVLDLFCGDGFFSRYFYATIAGHIDAVDKDPAAIEHAKRYHSDPKINFMVFDALSQDFPRSSYDVIVWFEAIEHLHPNDYHKMIPKIKSAIGGEGVLIGSTPLVQTSKTGKTNWEHYNEFTSISQLQAFLAQDFSTIIIDVTEYPTIEDGKRVTAYFTLQNPK